MTTQRSIDRIRRRLKPRLVEKRGPWCQVGVDGCDGVAVDMHEKLTRRRGGDPTDPDNILLVCRACHGWVHAHPVDAAEQGWLVWSWDGGDAA